jgi:hypothetical protein
LRESRAGWSSDDVRQAHEHKRASALRSPIVSIVGGLAAVSTLLVMFGLGEVRNAPAPEPQSDGRIAGLVTDRSSPGVSLHEPTTTTLPAALPSVPIPATRAATAVLTTPTTAAPVVPAPVAAVAPVVQPAAVVVASAQAEPPAPAKKERGKHRPHRPHDPHQPQDARGPRAGQATAAAAAPVAPVLVDPGAGADRLGRQPHKPHTPHQSRRDRADGVSAQEEDCNENAANDA